MATILIGADLCPIDGNRPYFESGDARSLFNDLLAELEQADLTIANLECPLIETPSPILKTGPVFGESASCVNAIKQAGIDVLALANNHAMDHGPEGLKYTLEVCAKAGIATVGAGENLAAARRILIKEAGGIRVGILAAAEREFSIATRNSWGANPLDLIDYVRNVRQSQNQFDYLVVLYHGSDEFHVPTPRVKDTCRFLIEMGAHAVIVQHPHCVGGYESYQNGHIVYGQGAWIMDEAIYRNRPSFHEGFLVRLHVAKDATARMELVPYVQSEPVPGARRMPPEREQNFLRMLQERANAVTDDGFVDAEWVRFCEENRHDYLSCLLGHNRILSKLNRAGLVERVFHTHDALLRSKNIVCCETHREAVETLFARSLL